MQAFWHFMAFLSKSLRNQIRFFRVYPIFRLNYFSSPLQSKATFKSEFYISIWRVLSCQQTPFQALTPTNRLSHLLLRLLWVGAISRESENSKACSFPHIELFFFSTAIKGYVYIWISIFLIWRALSCPQTPFQALSPTRKITKEENYKNSQ